MITALLFFAAMGHAASYGQYPFCRIMVPVAGMAVAQSTFTLEQSVAADMQGLVPLAPPFAIYSKDGATVALTSGYDLHMELLIEQEWLDPSTFALYMFDGGLWSKARVAKQARGSRTIGTASLDGLYDFTGVYAAFARRPALDRADGLLIRTEWLRATTEIRARRRNGEDWYETTSEETSDRRIVDAPRELTGIAGKWSERSEGKPRIFFQRYKLDVDASGIPILRQERVVRLPFMKPRTVLTATMPIEFTSGTLGGYLAGQSTTVTLDRQSLLVAAKVDRFTLHEDLTRALKGRPIVDGELEHQVLKPVSFEFDGENMVGRGGLRSYVIDYWAGPRKK